MSPQRGLMASGVMHALFIIAWIVGAIMWDPKQADGVFGALLITAYIMLVTGLLCAIFPLADYYDNNVEPEKGFSLYLRISVFCLCGGLVFSLAALVYGSI